MRTQKIVKGNEIFYNYSTKLEECNFLYGVTPRMRKDVEEKLEKQKNYLKNTFLSFDGIPTCKSLFDLNSSANIQPQRYHGEIWNRVQGLQQYAKDVGFTVPVFITITPRTVNKPTKQIFLKKNVYKLVDNPNFSAFTDGSVDYVKQTLEYISHKWQGLLKQRVCTDIKKATGTRLIFMRTYEPHIDGTPHAHIVCFVPPSFKDRFVEVCKDYFIDSRCDIKTEFEDEKGGVIAYILKYILKSFENAKNGILDTVACWYSYYKVRRFTTSRTLIPLSVFHKIQKQESLQNIYEVTKLFKKGYFEIGIACHPLAPTNENFIDLKNKDYKISTITYLLDDGDDVSFQVLYEKNYNIDFYVPDPKHKDKLKAIINTQTLKTPVQIVGDLRTFILKEGKLVQVYKSLNNYSHYDLFAYYQRLDVDTCNLHHFGLVQNECIRRGLIKGDLQNINDFNTNIGA